jgi:hypothetical protein
MLDPGYCGTAVRQFRNRTKEDVHETVSLSVSKASPVPVECDNHKMASETFSRSVGKKPVFFLSRSDWKPRWRPVGSRGRRKFPFLLCFDFRRRIQNGDGSRDPWT